MRWRGSLYEYARQSGKPQYLRDTWSASSMTPRSLGRSTMNLGRRKWDISFLRRSPRVKVVRIPDPRTWVQVRLHSPEVKGTSPVYPLNQSTRKTSTGVETFFSATALSFSTLTSTLFWI
jgi:hypothetical protein